MAQRDGKVLKIILTRNKEQRLLYILVRMTATRAAGFLGRVVAPVPAVVVADAVAAAATSLPICQQTCNNYYYQCLFTLVISHELWLVSGFAKCMKFHKSKRGVIVVDEEGKSTAPEVNTPAPCLCSKR